MIEKWIDAPLLCLVASSLEIEMIAFLSGKSAQSIVEGFDPFFNTPD